MQPLSVKSSVSSKLLPELRRAGSAGSAKALPLAADSAKAWALGVSALPLSARGLAAWRPAPPRESPDMARDARSSMLLCLLLSLCSTLCTLYVVICTAQGTHLSGGCELVFSGLDKVGALVPAAVRTGQARCLLCRW